jgi:deoxyhypusine synthase
MSQCAPRPLKRLYDRREELLDRMRMDYFAAKLRQPEQPTVSVTQTVTKEAIEREPVIATYPCGTPIRNGRK